MKELGEYLRQTRIEKNISLKDVQEKTKIRLYYLEAIENGDFEAIPGEVYRKGFLVNFANAVGLDGQQILERYNQLKAASIPAPVLKNEAELNSVKVSEKKEKKETATTRIRLKKSANLWIGISIIITVIMGLLIAFLIVPLIKEKTISLIKVSDAVSKVTHNKLQQKSKTSSNTEITEATDDSTVQTQILPAPVTVYAEFTQDVWVQVTADGQKVFMENGETFYSTSPKQVWTAQKEMIITMGNPAGIKLSLNGKDLGPIGERGIPKTITLTPDGLSAP